MTEPHGHRGHPRHGGWGGGPPWASPDASRPGRKFRRGALVGIAIVILLVAALASIVASALSSDPPSAWITIVVAALVVAGLVLTGRWLWRNARAIGTLMDAADRVAGGDYATRVPDTGSRQLGRLSHAFNQMTERLQTDEERRRELLADIAHELRTPLQVIRGTVEGMLDGVYPADPERLRPLVDETAMMARLLDDLRTLSMAEAGVLALYPEPVDPRVVVDDAVGALRAMAERQEITLAVDTSDGPSGIEADPLRLSEILTNLLTNAIRHTPEGGTVTVGLAATGHDAVFEVTDTGSGIAADELPFVFDRFVTAADTGGTGLGLTIAKRLVEAHHGTIEAVSPSDMGTTIRFTVPLD